MRKKHKLLYRIGMMIIAIVIILLATTMAFAIVYVPVPSYTLVSPTVPGFYVVGGSDYAYYTVGFVSVAGASTNVSGIEPLPTLNPNDYNSSAPTNPMSPLAQVWADLWDVPVVIPWIIGSMFLAICTFIAIAYKFQHIGFAMSGACLVLGFFSYPDVHILPVAVFIMSIVGLVAGVVIEAKA